MALIDIIKWDGNDQEFVWKYPSENLRRGSQLVVKPGQVAFFVSRGKICDEVREGTLTLETNNLPMLTSLLSLPFGGNTPFQAEVWFVNLISKLDNKWGTIRPIQLEDPKYGLVVPVRAFGQYGFKISNAHKFFEVLTGTAKVFTAAKIVEYFTGLLVHTVNVVLGKAFIEEKLSILDASTHLDILAQKCKQFIQAEMDRFGIELVNFFFYSINIPEDDPSYQKLKDLKERMAELNMLGRDIYQYERSIDVLKTAAGNPGGGLGSMMQAGMGIAVGANIGQQMSQQQFGGLMTRLPDGGVPPPVPVSVLYHVAVNGQAAGPYDESVLRDMIRKGQFTPTTMVWKTGMQNWMPASSVPEVAALFTAPPPVPPVPQVPPVPPTV